MIDIKIIKKAKQGHVSVGGGIATAGNSYTTGIQQTLADVLNFNAGLTRLLKPYDANNQPLTWAQATDPDGDGGIKAKTLRAAVTFASVGDIVAYQNGNLSGGTGGGGLDITALEDYLTTNGYATQSWVSAHFNDYVLTKAAVEAVLTGNITTHTHNQYLTEHQSLANYYTKAESDGKYLLSSAYTASDILTKIKTVDGDGSGLDADMLDGVHGKDYMYRNAYNFSNGCLVRLKLLASGNDMVTVHIRGNSYGWGLMPINTLVQFYNYNSADNIIHARALHNGYDFGNINVFCYDGHVYLWLKQKDNYQSFSVYAECTSSPHIGNLVENITNAAMPTEGVTRLVTITPKQSALTTGNVASATKLQTARTINGTAFDGTAGITTAKWGTARNLTIGNTAKSVDGSGNVAWSLAEIGALGVNANAVSASKLQTARTIWGQSFDGTDNVAGTLSGVEDITFNANAKIAATDNHLRLLTKSGGTQGLAAAQLLASDLYADWAKVPTNGIYSKGDIATDGSLKIGGGTITWDAGNNAFMFSHTVASQGDMVAFQNGNLSGGTGGGGLDITALEGYLTTNGYATQDWVSAHFNDYVLTKAAVEAVLTGNITTHTHNQYLTEHQSLANYYTKTESDGKYLTAINKSMVEAVLTGNITTHTHSQYLTAHQSLANYMTRGEISDTYQTKNAALSFSAASGYVAARFTDAALATAAAQNYIELCGTDGWFNLQAGHLLAHGAVTATQFIKTGGTATQFLKADGSVDSNSYALASALGNYLPLAGGSMLNTNLVSNLNADMLDGVHKDAFNGAVRYVTANTRTGGYYKIKIKDRRQWMLSFKIIAYQNYTLQEIVVTGYNYEKWYRPSVALVNAQGASTSDTVDVTFGYDDDGLVWVAIPARNWAGILVTDVANGLQQVSDVHNLFEIVYEATLLGTVKTILTASRHATIADNVASASQLQTSRLINGTAFDGTAAITTAKWGTARNLTIGNTAKSVDGSSAMAWSLAEIGALGVNANAVSASKLQTAHTLWGQSFDGTDNVAGTLSGVEDIIFNANARLTAMDNALRFFTKSGGAQGIQAGNLLISDLFSDANKVPENGIYSRDGLVTDGTIKIGGGTITWDADSNSFIFSHTIASQGNVVAFKE